MQISRKGLALIKKYEGFKPKAYYCPAGLLSIGYGHVIDKDKERYSVLTVTDAHNLLLSDLNNAIKVITTLVQVPLKQGQFDALCSLIYNWGGAGFSKSLGLKYLNQKDYTRAAEEFFSRERGVVNIKGVFSRGLYNRRQAELELWNEDQT